MLQRTGDLQNRSHVPVKPVSAAKALSHLRGAFGVRPRGIERLFFAAFRKECFQAYHLSTQLA